MVQRLKGHRLVSPSWMRDKNLREWLRDHRSAEAAAEAETETESEGEKSGPEGRERETAEGMEDGGGRNRSQPSGRWWWI